MSKYYDLEKLKDMIESKAQTLLPEGKTAFLTVGKWLDFLPAADVQEVKHGQWIHDESCSFCEHRCSQCGYKWAYDGIDVQYYCPTCGAKMDL